MKRRDLTEIIGQRDGRAISRALSANWESWGRFERHEAAVRTTPERRRRREYQLSQLGVRYVR